MLVEMVKGHIAKRKRKEAGYISTLGADNSPKVVFTDGVWWTMGADSGVQECFFPQSK